MKLLLPKTRSALLCAALLAASLSACGAANSTAPSVSAASADASAAPAQSQAADQDALKVVCTIFPEYDWTRQVLGDLAEQTELTLLMTGGADLHSYQPTTADIVRLSDADLFVYVGGASDAWVQSALQNATNPDMVTLDLTALFADEMREEELVEGMEAEEEHDHAEDEAETEYDEHLWLSLKKAQRAVGAIADSLAALDPDNAQAYQSNAQAYQAQLAQLDARCAQMVSGAARTTLLFGDRFPFRYLVEDYGLDYYAAFPGCSAETEASFETVAFLADKLEELALPVVLVLDGSDQKLANTIIQSTTQKDQTILTLNSMQTAPAEGESYLDIMTENVAVLEQALN